MGDRIQQGRELRAELAEIESGVATEEERTEAYLAGLQREKEGWLQVRERGLAVGDRHELLLGSGLNGARLKSEKTGLELAEEAEQAIAAVEAELERVGA